MPGRFISCTDCGTEIDTDYDDYAQAACGCCWRCPDCSPYTGDDDDYYDDDDGTYGRDRRVHPWDYRPDSWKPKGNYPAEALMGLELEIGGRERQIAPIVAGFDPSESHLYMKQDGSITGVEIVTHPATLKWSRTFDWSSLLQQLRDSGCEIDDGYGLHIHVSRNAFRRVGYRSTPHQMAWLMFMYRHSVELQKLARRRSSRWASFREPERGELKRKSSDRPSDDDRYVAVNCNNSKTYELRFFQSTLEYSELFAALEFADASVEYTRGIKTADVLRGQALTWQHFVTWVSKRDYPHLAAELARVASEMEGAARRARVRRSTPRRHRDDAIAEVGHGGVIEHFSSGERYAVAYAAARDVWYMRALSSSNGASYSWLVASAFIPDDWTPVDGMSAPADYFPVNV